MNHPAMTGSCDVKCWLPSGHSGECKTRAEWSAEQAAAIADRLRSQAARIVAAIG